MKNKRPIKNTWYDYIPEPIRKTVGGFKNKVVSLFKTNTLKNYGKKSYTGDERNQANQKQKNSLKKV